MTFQKFIEYIQIFEELFSDLDQSKYNLIEYAYARQIITASEFVSLKDTIKKHTYHVIKSPDNEERTMYQ